MRICGSLACALDSSERFASDLSQAVQLAFYGQVPHRRTLTIHLPRGPRYRVVGSQQIEATEEAKLDAMTLVVLGGGSVITQYEFCGSHRVGHADQDW